MKNFTFEERYYNAIIDVDSLYDETTYYFTGDKEFLNSIYPDKYPEAHSCCLTMTHTGETFPENFDEISIEISPTKLVKDDSNESYEDYDWNRIELDEEKIKTLMKLIP